MTAVVLMARHGSHDRLGKVLCGRMDGVGLSEQGRAEARALARRLADQSVSALYSSPIQRAQETAEAAAEALGLPVEADSDLSEIDFGDWTGKRFDELEADPAWPVWNARRGTARPPGGESMLETQSRVARFLHRIAERHPGQMVVAFGHADPIKAGLCWALGLPLDLYDRFEISPASLSAIVIGDWGAKVHSINEAAA